MRALAVTVLLVAAAGSAAADPKLTVTPTRVHPGQPVLVSVTGSGEAPHGTAAGAPLVFFKARAGYQAVFAVPMDAPDGELSIEVDSAKRPAKVAVAAATYPEAKVVVEDELANPDAADRARIDADNNAIIAAARKATDVQLGRGFTRPPGEVTSPWGEWRTFNDGHRSQHLGLDLFAREGSKVKAINAGTVLLVRDTFLAGNIVVIAHGAGIASAYYHLSKVSVAEGDQLAAGAEVGLAGHTGRTTGPHLHLSVRVPGGFVDPAAFFKLPIAPAAPQAARR